MIVPFLSAQFASFCFYLEVVYLALLYYTKVLFFLSYISCSPKETVQLLHITENTDQNHYRRFIIEATANPELLGCHWSVCSRKPYNVHEKPAETMRKL